MREYVLIVRNQDGTFSAVRPTDPLNPGFDVEAIRAAGGEVVREANVLSVDEWEH